MLKTLSRYSIHFAIAVCICMFWKGLWLLRYVKHCHQDDLIDWISVWNFSRKKKDKCVLEQDCIMYSFWRVTLDSTKCSTSSLLCEQSSSVFWDVKQFQKSLWHLSGPRFGVKKREWDANLEKQIKMIIKISLEKIILQVVVQKKFFLFLNMEIWRTICKHTYTMKILFWIFCSCYARVSVGLIWP